MDRQAVIDGVLDFMGEDTRQSVGHMMDEVINQVAEATPSLDQIGDLLVDLSLLAEEAGGFAHRLSEAEITADRVDLEPDLALIAVLAEDFGGLHRASDGWPLHLATLRRPGAGRAGNLLVSRELRGPKGWLADFAPGDLVTFSATRGMLSLSRREPATPGAGGGDRTELVLSPRVLERLAAAVEEAHHGDQVPVDARELLAAGLIEGWLTGDGELHGDAPSGDEAVGVDAVPFGEILTAAGYEIDGTAVGTADSWEPYVKVSRTIRLLWAHQHHDRDGLDALTGTVDAFNAWCDDPTTTPDPKLLAAIHRDPEVAFCVEDELIDASFGRHHEMRAFLDRFETPRGRRAAVLLALKAAAAEADGDFDAARDLTSQSLAADPLWLPAVEARAREVSVRGNLAEAVRLLQVARTHEDTELQTLRALQKSLSPDTPRNAPCPCGSGRKFKQCHLGKMELAPLDRAWWLLRRANEHFERYGSPDLDLVVGDGERSPLPEGRHLVEDAWLFDHGGFAAWLDIYSSMMDDADRAMAESWVSGQRPGAYRIDSAEGATMTVSDLTRGGDQLVVTRRGEGHDYLAPGDVVWMRVLPCGSLWWTGSVTRLLTSAEADALTATGDEHPPESEAGALERFRIISAIVDVPEVTGLGHPVVFCIQSWRLPPGLDEDEAASVLDDVAEREHPSTWALRGPNFDAGWLYLFEHRESGEAVGSTPDDDPDATTESQGEAGTDPLVSDATGPMTLTAVCRSIADQTGVAAMVSERFAGAASIYALATPRRRRIAEEIDEKVMREATEGPDEDWMDDDLYDDEYDDEEDYDGDWLTPSLPVIGIEDADDYDYDEDLGLG